MSLEQEIDARGVAILSLNRPQQRNAFDDRLIKQMIATLDLLETNQAVRIVVLRGKGEHFCAGADLHWMRQSADFDETENKADTLQLALMLAKLERLSKPTIAVVQGSCYGGGIGLVACCDIALAIEDTRFCFSEVRLGLAPATIAPYVVRAIGSRAATRYMLSAEAISAAQAEQMGLVHEVLASVNLEDRLEKLISSLLQGGPQAQAATKRWLAQIAPITDEVINASAEVIAERRASAEGQEGLQAFFDKRKPTWGNK